MNKIQKTRIPMELKQLKKTEATHGIRCDTNPPDSDDMSNLLAFIPGPKNSPYEDGNFKVQISFGEGYPFRPPVIKFETPVYHPNIDNAGKICLDILRVPPAGTYNPTITLESILLSIQLLLSSPNPDDPLRGDAADLFKTNPKQFNIVAREHVTKYCLNNESEQFPVPLKQMKQ